VLALRHPDGGVEADAVLAGEDEASVVFGFAWSYFHVEARRPRALVEYLASVLPRKRVDELYTAVGYHRHAKTELFRALHAHLHARGESFVRPPGARGLVMECVALPSMELVLKVIKDRFGAPKRTTRREVMERYQYVFVRDRVGRLADAQEFEGSSSGGATSPRRCSPSCRRRAHGRAPDGDRVLVTHAYTERQLGPLDVYARTAPPDRPPPAIVDYGQAIRDLAVANIFAGDLLLKNFGVSRHGRVIFYDYDELTSLAECRFRAPRPRRRRRLLARAHLRRARARRLPRGVRALRRAAGPAARRVRRRPRRPARPGVVGGDAGPARGRRAGRDVPLPAAPPARRRVSRSRPRTPNAARRRARAARGAGRANARGTLVPRAFARIFGPARALPPRAAAHGSRDSSSPPMSGPDASPPPTRSTRSGTRVVCPFAVTTTWYVPVGTSPRRGRGRRGRRRRRCAASRPGWPGTPATSRLVHRRAGLAGRALAAAAPRLRRRRRRPGRRRARPPRSLGGRSKRRIPTGVTVPRGPAPPPPPPPPKPGP
jgi:hypothetical protein